MAMIRDVTSAELEATIERSGTAEGDAFVLVDFWAPWCGPCRDLHKTIKDFAPRLGNDVAVLRLDVQSEQESAETRGIRAIPVLLLHKDGEQIARHGGSLTTSELANWLSSHGVKVGAEAKPARKPRYPEEDIRSLGAFYGNKELKDTLVRQVLGLARNGKIKIARTPFHLESGDTFTATVSAGLVGSERSELFNRLTNMPSSVQDLMEFCDYTDAEAIQALTAALAPGADYTMVPVRFMRAWLSDTYANWAELLQNDAADSVRRAWVAAAGDLIAGKEPKPTLDEIRQQALSLTTQNVEDMVVNHFAKLVAHSCTNDPATHDWSTALVSYGTVINYVEAGRAVGMTNRDLYFNDVRARFSHGKLESGVTPEEARQMFVDEHGEENDRVMALEIKQYAAVGEIAPKRQAMLVDALRDAEAAD
jgi:thioredoxin 1